MESTVIYRNFISPSRAFTQFSHEIIRHPRLSSDAVRLLTWQLSLPQGAREPLSRTAERARIGSCAFTRAKRQLKEEGLVHERRVQGAGGQWVTQQLVSSSPLSAAEAAKLLAGTPVVVRADPTSPQVAPSPRKRAAGQQTAGAPVTPPTGRHPEEDREGDTSNLPGVGVGAEPEPEPQPAETTESADEPTTPATATAPATAPGSAPPTSPHTEEARALIGALPLLSSALRRIPPGMRDELTLLAARWLDAGHTSPDVHEHILRGLPGAGTPVHRPGGLVRYLLRDVPPRALPPEPAASPNRLSVRLAGARECSGDHTQPMLFRPVADETLCPGCA
ncbi:hypothetical protein ABT034_21295 [Streptomyces sp. NPDC002773]|uniref:hypothetical protein n=1 Tax=Streptomyces sp. NPDC002773 TaxID=3154430 RepID=UPI00331AD324